ncbi:MAG: hypothetical protein GY868_02295 [Deltaproteobacteria bacterium]|nr:hypothetical protein [Deltaproteobacteria bacterium]
MRACRRHRRGAQHPPNDAALKTLLPLEKRSRPEAAWKAAVANAWLLKERYTVAATVMERAARISAKPEHRQCASQLWLHTENSEKILTPLKQMPCG